MGNNLNESPPLPSPASSSPGGGNEDRSLTQSIDIKNVNSIASSLSQGDTEVKKNPDTSDSGQTETDFLS